MTIEPMEITAGRLHLRPWVDADAPLVLRAFEDADTARWQAIVPIRTLDAALGWIAHRQDWSDGTHASFAVLDATTAAVLGAVSLQRIDLRTRDAGVAYWTLPEARGRGVAPQAVDVVTRWAFALLGLERIELCHPVENAPSCQVAVKAGYSYEGTLRQAFRDAQGRRYDQHLHARLPGDPEPEGHWT